MSITMPLCGESAINPKKDEDRISKVKKFPLFILEKQTKNLNRKHAHTSVKLVKIA